MGELGLGRAVIITTRSVLLYVSAAHDVEEPGGHTCEVTPTTLFARVHVLAYTSEAVQVGMTMLSLTGTICSVLAQNSTAAFVRAYMICMFVWMLALCKL